MVQLLIDGTYELFRHYYALPSARDADGVEVAAVRGVVGSVLGMINGGATHVARRDRPRHRVVPQRALARLQDERRHRARAAGAVPAARGRAARARRRGLADGRVRGRRRAGGGAALAAQRSARRAGRHLHARQGPRAVRQRHARRAARPAAQHDARRGRRRGEVRRAAGVDSRLSRARRRRRRRLSRPAAAGARSRPPPCSPGSATSRRFRTTGATWRVNAANAATPGRDARSASASTRCSSATWRRCDATSRCSTSVDELEWRGPTPAFAPLATRLDTAVHE